MHLQRLGSLDAWRSRRDDLGALLDESGLRGRGGAGFPAARKWYAVARADGNRRPIVVANGAEGEPLSHKDRVLLALHPHLVLDGLEVAAASLSADRACLWLPREFAVQQSSLARALSERREAGLASPCAIDVQLGPRRFVAGEASAVVAGINGQSAKPTFRRRRLATSGVDEHPTLLHNVETLAHIALIARFGSGWFRSVGTGGSTGSALVTGFDGATATVFEAPYGAPMADILTAINPRARADAVVLIGGYSGTWASVPSLRGITYDHASLRQVGASPGCGVVAVLDVGVCVVRETSRILHFLSRESAGQCGPCRHGLPAMAERVDRLARGVASASDLEQLHRVSDQVIGRGACGHPDGAVRLVRSLLTNCADDVNRHLSGGGCVWRRAGAMPVPRWAGWD